MYYLFIIFFTREGGGNMNVFDITNKPYDLQNEKNHLDNIPVNKSNATDINTFQAIVQSINAEARQASINRNTINSGYNDMMKNSSRRELANLLVNAEKDQLNSLLIGKISGKISQALEKILSQS